MTKKILLIGASGQLGQALAQEVRSAGNHLVTPTHNQLDITNEQVCADFFHAVKPSSVMNCSGYNIVPLCEKDPSLAFSVNCTGVAHLARLCAEARIPFVTFSTDYVFDGTKKMPYHEDDPPRPLQLYGISKAAGEFAALSYHATGSYIIRTCGVYGGVHGSAQKGGNCVLNFIRALEHDRYVDVSLDHYATPTYATHAARAVLNLLHDPYSQPGIYHLVNEGVCSWFEFANEIARLLHSSSVVRPVNRGGKDGVFNRPLYSVLANSKAKNLGVTLPSWQDGLRDYLRNELKRT